MLIGQLPLGWTLDDHLARDSNMKASNHTCDNTGIINSYTYANIPANLDPLIVSLELENFSTCVCSHTYILYVPVYNSTCVCFNRLWENDRRVARWWKGSRATNQLHDINFGALDNAFHAFAYHNWSTVDVWLWTTQALYSCKFLTLDSSPSDDLKCIRSGLKEWYNIREYPTYCMDMNIATWKMARCAWMMTWKYSKCTI